MDVRREIIKSSAAAGGAVGEDITFGDGFFLIVNASISVLDTTDGASRARLYITQVEGDGSLTYYTLATGHVHEDHAVVMEGWRWLKGPAKISSDVFHSGTTTFSHYLAAQWIPLTKAEFDIFLMGGIR